LLWYIWFPCAINQTNQMNKMNQIDETNQINPTNRLRSHASRPLKCGVISAEEKGILGARRRLSHRGRSPLSDHVENNTTRRGMKIHTAAAGMLCLTILTTGACVSRSTYDATIANLEATKAELGSARTQSQELIEQVSELQQLKLDLARQMEAAWSALMQAKQKMEAEHTASQEWLSKLARTISQLTAQQNSLRYALQRANEERPALQSIVEGYTSKLSEADGLRAPLSTPSIGEQAETARAFPAQGPAQTNLAPKPTVATPAGSSDAAVANPHPANKQTSEPVGGGWLSSLKGWIISLWQSIFS